MVGVDGWQDWVIGVE